MKTIKVKNKTEGSKVAFKILQEEITLVLRLWG